MAGLPRKCSTMRSVWFSRSPRRVARGRKGFKALKDILPATVDRIDELHQSDGSITGISTGYTEFDKLTAGLQGGDLVIIAGRPSMGKTTLAVNIAENAAIGSKKSTAIFSMEMPSQQLAFRMISSLGRVDQTHLRTGNFPDEDWSRINTAVQLMSEAPIHIDDTPSLSPTEIRARARRLQREHGLDLIVVDYLQLMQIEGTKENRATEISEISRGLKALAKELDVPVIALSQLNRSVEQRTTNGRSCPTCVSRALSNRMPTSSSSSIVKRSITRTRRAKASPTLRLPNNVMARSATSR